MSDRLEDLPGFRNPGRSFVDRIVLKYKVDFGHPADDVRDESWYNGDNHSSYTA